MTIKTLTILSIKADLQREAETNASTVPLGTRSNLILNCACKLGRVKGLGPAVLHMLPKLPLGRALLYHKQETSCIYVNNVGPWNAIMNFAITVPRDQLSLVLVLTTTLSLVPTKA